MKLIKINHESKKSQTYSAKLKAKSLLLNILSQRYLTLIRLVNTQVMNLLKL